MEQVDPERNLPGRIAGSLSPLRAHQLAIIAQLTLIFLIILFFQGILLEGLHVRGLWNSLRLSILLGPLVGLAEIALYPLLANRYSFPVLMLIKTLVNLVIVLLVLLVLFYLADSGFLSRSGYLAAQFQFALGRQQADQVLTQWEFLGRVVLMSLVICGQVTFVHQMIQKMGQRVFWRFVTGKYHQPREEDRIFMFLDLKGATTIAEQLGHARFSHLLADCFLDFTIPLLETRGEVYQYVGDQAVISWPTPVGIRGGNCIACFYQIDQALRQRKEYYLAQYGVVPHFKAGLHCGKVVTRQVGELKSEVVYHGDVLNTAARLEGQCNAIGRQLLLSGDLCELLKPVTAYCYAFVNSIQLRGKQAGLPIYTALPKRVSSGVKMTV
jgi:adenylate cyclase